MERSILKRPVAAVAGRITKGGALVARVKFADSPAAGVPITVSRDPGGVWRVHTDMGTSARADV